MIKVGVDAKRIVRNGTGLGSYGRTLVNDLIRLGDPELDLRLYAPDEGKAALREQVIEGATWCWPGGAAGETGGNNKTGGNNEAGGNNETGGNNKAGGNNEADGNNKADGNNEAGGNNEVDGNNEAGGNNKADGESGGRSRGAVAKAWWRTRGMVKDLVRDGVEVYHGLSGELPIGLRKAGIRGVVTIHDLIFMRHPEYYHWIDRKVYQWKFRQTLREADHIIAISERTRQDIIELGGEEYADRISVIYQSFSPRFSAAVPCAQKEAARERYHLPHRFILNVGTLEERKNVLLAAEALELLPQDIHLVAVGRQTSYVKRLSKSERIHLLSGVPNDDLATIYSLAEVFVYPSRYEGFGIPIIEAISMGLPVVACSGSCLEEAGGPDSLYTGPDDVIGMAEAIKMSLKGARGREERIARSLEYIRRFEGTNVAGQVAEMYKR